MIIGIKKSSILLFFLYFIAILLLRSLINSTIKKLSKTNKNGFVPLEGVKYVLLWSSVNEFPFSLGKGQRAFTDNHCTFNNCYVTSLRETFGDDVTKFDAIIFSGNDVALFRRMELPEARSARQKYIFLSMASPEEYPICSPHLEYYFNLTATFKLSSDIVLPYFIVRNIQDNVIGPRESLLWKDSVFDKDVDNDIWDDLVVGKSKAAAWFDSTCDEERLQLVTELKSELQLYGLNVDIYGRCGSMMCENRAEFCNHMLKKDYFFYLAFERTSTSDYVTELVLDAVQNFVVPIVNGGANYSRFLPPKAYLDAGKMSMKELASTMSDLINNTKLYSRYFNWRLLYSFQPSMRENICNLCRALNNKELMDRETVKSEFRKWWNPDFDDRCQLLMK